MLPPQSQQSIKTLARGDALKRMSMSKKKEGSQMQASRMSSIFKNEYDIQQNELLLKAAKKEEARNKSREEDRRDSGKIVPFGATKKGGSENGLLQNNRDYQSQFQGIQQDILDGSLLLSKICSAVECGQVQFSTSQASIGEIFYISTFLEGEFEKQMKDKAEGKRSKEEEKELARKMKQKEFIDRNYNKKFEEQQKVFNEHRAKKKQLKEDEENNYEKIDPKVWKASLAIMKYQVTKDQYKIEDKQMRQVYVEEPEPDKDADQAYKLEQQQLMKEQKTQEKALRKTQAKGISVKIKLDSTDQVEGYKKQPPKSEEEVEKNAKRLVRIQQGQDESDDQKANGYFIKIQKKLLMIMRARKDAEGIKLRNSLMKDLRDNAIENKLLCDSILSKYEGFLIEQIIDDILVENVFLLQLIEKKQKLPKKMVRNTILQEYKKCFIDYFDDSQQALVNLATMPDKPEPRPLEIIRYDNVLLQTGRGLLISMIDQKQQFSNYIAQKDHYKKNNVAMLNIISRDIAEELLDQVVDLFEKHSDEFSTQMFNSEFE